MNKRGCLEYAWTTTNVIHFRRPHKLQRYQCQQRYWVLHDDNLNKPLGRRAMPLLNIPSVSSWTETPRRRDKERMNCERESTTQVKHNFLVTARRWLFNPYNILNALPPTSPPRNTFPCIFRLHFLCLRKHRLVSSSSLFLWSLSVLITNFLLVGYLMLFFVYLHLTALQQPCDRSFRLSSRHLNCLRVFFFFSPLLTTYDSPICQPFHSFL